MGKQGYKTICALLDEGFTATLINYGMIKDLNTQYSSVNVSIKGISNGIYNLENELCVQNLALPIKKVSSQFVKFCFDTTGIVIVFRRISANVNWS